MNAYLIFLISIIFICLVFVCIVFNYIYFACINFLNDYYNIKIEDIEIDIDETTDEETDIICSICLEDNTDIKLPCSHVYHEECIEQWFHTSLSCPICRKNYELLCDDSDLEEQ